MGRIGTRRAKWAFAAVLAAGGVWSWFELVQGPRAQAAALADASRAAERDLDADAEVVGLWAGDLVEQARIVGSFPTPRAVLSGATEPKGDGHLDRVLLAVLQPKRLASIRLVDRSGGVCAVAGAAGPTPENVLGTARSATTSGRPLLVLAGREDEDGGRTAIVAAPVRSADDREWLGSVVLEAPAAGLDALVRAHAAAYAGATLRLTETADDTEHADARDSGARGIVTAQAAATPESGPAGSGASTISGDADDRVLRTVCDVAGTPWRLVGEVPVASIVAPVRESTRQGAVAASALILAAIGLAYGAARRHEASTALELARRDARLARVLDQTNDVVIVVSADGAILDVGGRVEEMYGRTAADLRGRPVADLRPPELRADLAETLERVAKTPTSLYETTHVRADGSTFPVECSTRLVETHGPERIVAVVRDVRARRLEERRRERIQRFLRTLTHVNQLICRTGDRKRLVEATCDAIAVHGGFLASWIAFVEPSTSRVVAEAAAGAARSFAGIDARCDDSPEGRGAIGASIRERRPVVIEDVAADPRSAPWREAARAAGVRSLASAPIEIGGRVVGALVVCAAELDACDGEMLGLLGELAVDVGFALQVIGERTRAEAERSASEEALHRSESGAREGARELQAVLDTVPVAVWIARDPSCRTASGNRAACELLGFPPGADIGIDAIFGEESPVARVVCDGRDLSPEELAPVVAVRTGAPVRDAESTIHFRDGSTRHVLGYAAQVLGDRGRCVGAVGVIVDVTSMVRANRELGILRQAIDQSPASVVLTDAGGTIEYVNRRFTEVTGYQPDEVLGRNPRVLKSGQTPPETHREMWETIAAGREWRGNFVNRRKDGGLFSEIAVVSPIHDADGSVTHYLAVKEDVTRRVQTEAALANVQGELAQAQKMEAVGRLAGGVAHDFNNMLAVIMGYTDMTLAALAPEHPQRSALDQVSAAAQRAAGLTRRLLAFSRKQVIEPRVVDLNEVVGGMCSMLKRLIGEDIDLSTHLADDAGAVRVDPGQLEHALVNLAVNARDAMPRGGRLAITTAADDASPHASRAARPSPAGWVRISVADTGSGIPSELQDRIFEPFFTTKTEGKGTGLGLSTAYGIVQQSGGVIWFESEAGRGTSFHVLLPRCATGAEAVEAPVAAPSHGDAPRTVLLVEDDRQVRDLSRLLLEGMGCRVVACDRPEHALRRAAASTERIDLLLTDVVMPGMSGHELARRLGGRIAGGRVLFMSGYIDGDFARSAEIAPGTHLLRKPFTRDQLAAKVHEALAAAPARAGPVTATTSASAMRDPTPAGARV